MEENSKIVNNWTESCIGRWTRSVVKGKNGQLNGTSPTCYGINFVRVKDPSLAHVKSTNTIGITVYHSDEETVFTETDKISSFASNISANVDERLTYMKSHVRNKLYTVKKWIEDRWL